MSKEGHLLSTLCYTLHAQSNVCLARGPGSIGSGAVHLLVEGMPQDLHIMQFLQLVSMQAVKVQ